MRELQNRFCVMDLSWERGVDLQLLKLFYLIELRSILLWSTDNIFAMNQTLVCQYRHEILNSNWSFFLLNVYNAPSHSPNLNGNCLKRPLRK